MSDELKPEMKTEALLPCPFCGAAAQLETYSYRLDGPERLNWMAKVRCLGDVQVCGLVWQGQEIDWPTEQAAIEAMARRWQRRTGHGISSRPSPCPLPQAGEGAPCSHTLAPGKETTRHE